MPNNIESCFSLRADLEGPPSVILMAFLLTDLNLNLSVRHKKCRQLLIVPDFKLHA